MDYAALKSELDDPVYKNMDDEAIADAINAKTTTKLIMVSAREIRSILFSRGKWLSITKKSNAARSGLDTSDEGALCQTLYDLAADSASVDMADPGTAQAALGGLSLLVAKDIISQEDSDALVAAATRKVPWWEENGFGEPIGLGFITNTRKA